MRRKIREGGWLHICLVAKGWKIGLWATMTVEEVGPWRRRRKVFALVWLGVHKYILGRCKGISH